MNRIVANRMITPRMIAITKNPGSLTPIHSSQRKYAIYNPPSSPNMQPIAVKLGGPGGSSGGQQGGGQLGALGFPATYNELPVPSGDWMKNYVDEQQKYNKHLVVGIAFFGFTVFNVKRVVGDFMMSPVSLEVEDDEAEFCKAQVQVEVKKCE